MVEVESTFALKSITSFSDTLPKTVELKFGTSSSEPSYGTIWINNGIANKKILKTDNIPDGWAKGRYFNDLQKTIFVSRSKVGKNNPRYDNTVYVFLNEKTGEKYQETSYRFSEKLNLRKKCIRALVQGKREKYKDWKIIKDYFEI